MVYINLLAVNGNVALPPVERMSVPRIRTERQSMIHRKMWDVMLSKIQLGLEPALNDGIVIVTPFRTLKLKQPIVDLLYQDRFLNRIDNEVLNRVAAGHEKMVQGVIYELDVIRKEVGGPRELVKPRERTRKKVLNNIVVIRRAVASVGGDSYASESLVDITAMYFRMWSKVYESAQTRAPVNRKVIVRFGVGRFQE